MRHKPKNKETTTKADFVEPTAQTKGIFHRNY